MAFSITTTDAAITVELRGWDRTMNGRRRLEFGLDTVSAASVHARAGLEALIDHRALGCGTHNGSKRPGRRRIGTMLGRGVAGKQFWAARKGSGSTELLVLDLVGQTFARAVLEIDEPHQWRDVIDDLRPRD